MRILGSELIPIADSNSVPAGQALAVDREEFSKKVTEKIENESNIEVIRKEITEIPKDKYVVIATGPLTSNDLANQIQEILGQKQLYFYDAAAPIVEKDSIDMNIAFYGDRYSEEKGRDEDYNEWIERIKNEEASYINLPMKDRKSVV